MTMITWLRGLAALACLAICTGLAGSSERVLYEWWPGGYWHGCYYPAGYYVVRQPVVYTYAVSYDTDTAALIAAIDRVARAVEALRAERAEQATTGSDVLRQRCAQCHSGQQAKGGFALLVDGGGLAKLTVEDRSKVISRIHSTDPRMRMPPTGPLTDSERRLVDRLMFGEE
jgi:mono/diheme cytochrome c family protein